MKTLAAAFAMGATLLTVQAHAATTYFRFFNGSDTIASGVLTTSTTGDSELIDSLKGEFGGAPIVLAPVGSVDFYAPNNNLFYPTGLGEAANPGLYGGSGGYLDGAGLGFYSGGSLYGIYYIVSNPGPYYNFDPIYGLEQYTDGAFYAYGSLSLTAPEPGAWALTLFGFAGLGAMLRHRRGRLALG